MTLSAWWDEFFAGPWPHIEAGGYPAERTSAECNVIEASLQLRPGDRVLDIPCGVGRHSVELARRGFRMTGVDLVRESITLARASAATAGVDIRFLIGDMREFASDELFDAAFCYFGSFGYFSEADNLTFVRAVSAALTPGARFLIEGHIAETLLPIYRDRDWFWAGAPDNRVRVLEERSWKIETGRVESTWTIVHGSGARSTDTSIRIYTYRELRALLEAADFVNVDARDGKTGQPLQIGAPRALVVAEKRP